MSSHRESSAPPSTLTSRATDDGPPGTRPVEFLVRARPPPNRIRRCRSWDHHDPHGARPRARLLRLAGGESDRPRADDARAVHDPLDHAHLRAGVLPAHGDRRVPGAPTAIATRALLVP